jgi:hypothetical protein
MSVPMAGRAPPMSEMLAMAAEQVAEYRLQLVRFQSDAWTMSTNDLSPRARTPMSASPGPWIGSSTKQEVSDGTDQGQGGGPRYPSRHHRGLLSDPTTEPTDRHIEAMFATPGLGD